MASEYFLREDIKLDILISISGAAGLIFVFKVLVQCRQKVTRTTLQGPVHWGIAGILLWIIAWVLQIPALSISTGILDQIWYAVPVLLLSPFVAVLGARKPGAHIWGWFIIVPMCLVLEISAVRLWGNDWIPVPFTLDTPTIFGFSIVMVMGLGNYFGTKRTGAVLLFALILILLVAPYSESVPKIFPQKTTARILATFLLIGLVFLLQLKKETDQALLPLHLIWFEFLDSYGVVWGKRFLDQMNQTAHEQQWTFHLELDGFVYNEDQQPVTQLDETEAEKIKRAFYRHLKRFVEPEWIDQRL